MLEYIGAWGSIIGVILSIITLILAGSIKSALRKREKTILFTLNNQTYCKELKNLCSKFLDIYDQLDKQKEIQSILYEIKTKLKCLQRIAPKNLTQDIKQMIEKTNTYYSKGRFVLKKCDDNEVTTDELYTVYTETQGIVNTLMDMNQSHGYGY